ncbi:hypothetical protein [Mucilaginibacter terrae]|uniref:O-antigen ligase domain-containing protein n=1 Tax=Mucilaginibacter terrae TaxID=1955052 RepID=A0ABU3GYE5_9SPHI|nr:hypothetical protein [Mucilaginibacter terrae]MDT3404789.1 hypothetical protein [Mucilaginibacter terrae]
MIIVKDILDFLKSFKKDKKLRLSSKEKQIADIKRWIWIYFWLLVFEGALRKWVLPFLATPLLIVRDPVAIILIIKAQNAGLFKVNGLVIVAWIVTILSFLMTMLVGHRNVYVAFFGARIMLLHFPIIFLIGAVFTREDVLRVGEIVMWLAIPMTVLMGLQFYSPQNAWVNRGIGGDEAGGGFAGAMGFFRPPGTFSFINGLVSFYGWVTAYVMFFWLDERPYIKKWLLFGITGCVVAAIPLSISRTFFFQVIVSGVFAAVIALRNPKISGKFMMAGASILILFTVLGKASFFQTGTAAFTERLTVANNAEGGAEGVFLGRFIGGLLGGLTENANVPFFGYGLGLGTNAGAKLQTGATKFLFNAEVEWGRVIGEMGFLLGVITIFCRVAVTFDMTLKSFAAIGKKDYLPWMLLSFILINVAQGQWAQPTSLGFGVFTGGLILALLRPVKRRVVSSR